MNLAAVMDEAAGLIQLLDGVHKVYGWPPETVTPPAGYVSYPQAIEYDQTYGRGVDKIVGLPIAVVSTKVTEKAARDRVAAWSAGKGPQSVKQLLEQHRWLSCDDLTITSCSFDVETIADIDHLVAIFLADVTGPGGV